ncbi:TetR family transcriptional regulator [Streptomyces sp. NPDC007117]|uniref:TetR family transcriptional regulator n=1 Tax=Streptomyces sp. NPDC007117 TaxID=3154314 RepID=UPI003405BA31
MPTARQALLEAALRALSDRPWHAVRMVDVAALADVSRQTLYNEFGTKGGLPGSFGLRASSGRDAAAGPRRAAGAGAGPDGGRLTRAHGRALRDRPAPRVVLCDRSGAGRRRHRQPRARTRPGGGRADGP